MSTNPTKLPLESIVSSQLPVFPLKEKNDNSITRLMPFAHFMQHTSAQKSSIDPKLQTFGEKQIGENPELASAIYNNLKTAQPQHFFLNLSEIPDLGSQTSQKKSKSNLSTTPSRESENHKYDSSYEIVNKTNLSPYTTNKLIFQSKAKNQNIIPILSDKSQNFGNNSANQTPIHQVEYSHTIGDVPFYREKASPIKKSRRQITSQKLSDPYSDPQSTKQCNSSVPKSASRLLFSQKIKESSPSIRSNNVTPYSPIRSQSQNQLSPGLGNDNSKLDVNESNSANIVLHIKENLKHVSQCREHNNQPLTFFNSLTKQLVCIECVHYEIGAGSKRSIYLTLNNAFNEISELNKTFKLESQEKIHDIDSQLQIYKSNYNKIQDNLNNMLDDITKQFKRLYDELRTRELKLTAAIRESSERHQTNIKTQIENLEFLKVCYRDAKEVNPNSSVEQCVHFYAVFNLLKNASKLSERFPCNLSQDDLDRIEFNDTKETRSLIEKFGFIKRSKKRSLHKTLKKHRMSLGNINLKKSRVEKPNHSFELKTPSPVKEIERRATTPNKYETEQFSPPPVSSYLERESMRNRIKTKDIQNKQLEAKSRSRKNSSNELKSQSPNSQGPVSKGKNSKLLERSFESQRAQIYRLAPQGLVISKKGGDGALTSSKERTESDNFSKIESINMEQKLQTSDFMSPRNHGTDLNYFGIQYSNDLAMMRLQDSLNQVTTSDFAKGSEIYFESASFNGESLHGLFMDSKILTNSELRNEIASVLNEKVLETRLLYSLSSDGPSSVAFHSKCDNQSPIVAIIHANKNYIFGYYMPLAFTKAEKYTQCDESFIFSLRNPESSGPRVFPIRSDKKFIAFYQSNRSPCLGSTITNKQDLLIDLDYPKSSCSNVGYAYKLHAGAQGTSVLAGKYTDWDIHEIEFYKIKV